MIFDSVLAQAYRLSRYAAWVGGGMMLLAAVMVTGDVLSRRIMGITMSGSDEISGYLFAIATALAMPFALLSRANVRIDAVYNLTPSWARYAMDLFGLILLAVFSGLVTWRAALTVEVTWENGSRAITPLQTPLIVPQSMWLAGWVLFCLCLALMVWGMLRAGLRRDLIGARKLAGVQSVDEEVSEETAGLLLHRVREA